MTSFTLVPKIIFKPAFLLIEKSPLWCITVKIICCTLCTRMYRMSQKNPQILFFGYYLDKSWYFFRIFGQWYLETYRIFLSEPFWNQSCFTVSFSSVLPGISIIINYWRKKLTDFQNGFEMIILHVSLYHWPKIMKKYQHLSKL